MKFRIVARARDDLDRLHAFLSTKNPKAADRAVDTIYEAALSLRHESGKGRPRGRDFRELIVRFGKGAYIVRYRVDENAGAVVVLRIWHSRERKR